MADGLLNKASIILTPTGYKAGTLYNVAPVVEPYEDFDFARASVASRVNSSGLVEMVGRTLSSELVVNGDFATDSDWTFSNIGGSNGWRIADGRAICDTSAATKNRNLTSSLSLDGSKDYKLTIDILQSADNITIYVGATALSRNLPTGENLGYEYYISSSDHSGGALMFYAGSSDLQEIDNVSVKEIIDTNNIPRISYDSNGQNGHILLEPTSTNLVTYSQEFGTSKYFNVNQASIVSNNNLAPDGTNTATQLLSSGAGKLQSSSLTLPANTTYTLSFFVKNVDATEVQSRALALGGSGGTNLTSVSYFSQINTTTFTRITHIFTTNSTEENYILYISNALNSGGNIQLWGAQLEELSFATSYIPTLTGSTETRATETATGAGSAELINSTEGVLYAEIAALVDDSTNRVISLSDGTGSNVLKLFYKTSSNSMQVQGFVGGSLQLNRTQLLSDITQLTKIALRYKTNDFAWYINGVKVTTDTSTNTWSANTLYKLNFDDGNDGIPFYGKCKALAVFNEALSDAELNNLTG